MIKKNKIPTLLGIVLLLVGTFAGVFFLGMKQFFKIGADSSAAPKNIRVANVTDSSAVVSWTTDKPSTSFLVWGESESSTTKIEKESQSEEKFTTHSITLSGLKPQNKYFYKINSNGETFNNNGISWNFTTGQMLDINGNNILISGSVLTTAGKPVKRALIYSDVSGYLFSTITSDTGNFVFQLASARTQDLGSYLPIDEKGTLVRISIDGGIDGSSSVQIFPQSAKPIPPIILGQVYDHRNLAPSSGIENPNAVLNLPTNINKESKFIIPTETAIPGYTSVILESLKEGEILTSDKPAFFGRGPSGVELTITVESDPITEKTLIAKDGTWTWSPPVNLATGTHSVTVSWVDISGITRNIRRTFVVQAGEIPSFEATPSQTLAPSVSPTPIGTPVPTATPTPIPTPVPVPETGTEMPTIMLTILGFSIFMFGMMMWKFSDS